MIFVPKEIEDELCETDQLEIEREVVQESAHEWERQVEEDVLDKEHPGWRGVW